MFYKVLNRVGPFLVTIWCRMNSDTVHSEGFKIFERPSVPPYKRELTFPGCLEHVQVVETGIKYAM